MTTSVARVRFVVPVTWQTASDLTIPANVPVLATVQLPYFVVTDANNHPIVGKSITLVDGNNQVCLL